MAATHDAPTVSVTKCLAVLHAAARFGLDPAPLRTLVGFELQAPLRIVDHVPCSHYLTLWESVMRAVDDPGFPMAVARTPVEEYELFGFLVMTSKNIGEAFERGARFQRLLASNGQWENARRQKGHVVLGWTPISGSSGLGARAATEYSVASMLVGIRALSGRKDLAKRVTFSHPRPKDTSAHRELFGVEPAFAAPANTLELDGCVFDLPIPTGNVPLSAYLEEQCKALLDSAIGVPSVSTRLRSLFIKQNCGDVPSLQRAARQLGMSSRTLSRRLTEEGTSFHVILDEVRRDFALRYLSQERLSVSEVAYLTGFRSVSAFYRAYRRWTGTLPGSARRSLAR
jgi:AraC-like DNA-binding protein